MATPFQTTYNVRDVVTQGEINTMPSTTQPDQVLSIKEMLERHVRGLPINGVSDVYYDEDYPEDLPDLKTMDLVEIQEARDFYKNETARIQKELKAREKADKQAFIEKQVREEQQKQKEQPPEKGADNE